MAGTSRLHDMGGIDLKVRSVLEGYADPERGVKKTLAAGGSLTLTEQDSGKIVLLDTASGSTVVLPTSTGSGRKYRFFVSVIATTNNHIVKVGNTTDVMRGTAHFADTDGTAAVDTFITASTSDTITLNRSTTGSVTVGEYIEVEDIIPGFFLVRAFLSNTTTPATPFSATV